MRGEPLRWRDVRSTTPFRLTLLLGVIFLAGLWATLAFSYVLTARELTERSDRILFARARSLLAEDASRLPARIDAEIANAAPGFSYFALQSATRETVAGNINLQLPEQPGRPFNLEADGRGRGPLRILAVRTGSGETIILGRDVSQIRALRGRLLDILLTSGVIGTLLVLLAASVLSLPPLRRVRDLERASRRIAAGHLADRMPIAGRNDELDQFAATVNRMVEEVGRVIAQVKSATDAVAHDLRTPLTRVRASLYGALASASEAPSPTKSEHTAIIEDALADLDHVIERFAALLRISELEASAQRARLHPIDPGPLLLQLAELYRPLAEERGIELIIQIAPLPSVEADRELLFEAFANLLDNAIKFGRTSVWLRAHPTGDDAIIEFVDDGIGIADEEKEAVLLRFHRAQGAAGVPGTGLGLAIVSAILHLHGFVLNLSNGHPGLVARVRTSRPTT